MEYPMKPTICENVTLVIEYPGNERAQRRPRLSYLGFSGELTFNRRRPTMPIETPGICQDSKVQIQSIGLTWCQTPFQKMVESYSKFHNLIGDLRYYYLQR
jgi:hypothetical protein